MDEFNLDLYCVATMRCRRSMDSSVVFEGGSPKVVDNKVVCHKNPNLGY